MCQVVVFVLINLIVVDAVKVNELELKGKKWRIQMGEKKRKAKIEKKKAVAKCKGIKAERKTSTCYIEMVNINNVLSLYSFIKAWPKRANEKRENQKKNNNNNNIILHELTIEI